MLFIKAIEKSLLDKDLPVASFYGFFLIGHKLHKEKHYQEERLFKVPRVWDIAAAKIYRKRLEKNGFLSPDRNFKSGVWRVTQATSAGSAEEVICIVDPFAYVSHLSAMQRYGLTNRSPVSLHITTPSNTVWGQLRNNKVHSDLPDSNDIPEKLLLGRYGINDTVRRRPITKHMSSTPWTATKIRGQETRITSMGQTFADMLQEPQLCGGINHVLEVWETHAQLWIEEIIEVIDGMDSQIVKMRAGYIISQIMKTEHAILKKWEQLAQRGGSRKLDPEADYAPTYSERWMISINV